MGVREDAKKYVDVLEVVDARSLEPLLSVRHARKG